MLMRKGCRGKLSHTQGHAFLAATFHQPFRNTYGIAVWLATPIKPRLGLR